MNPGLPNHRKLHREAEISANSDPYLAGREARQSGEKNEVPARMNKENAEAWLTGWTDRDAEIAEAKGILEKRI